MNKIEALEFALLHVRGYSDRMFLQFLISVERRKNEATMSAGVPQDGSA